MRGGDQRIAGKRREQHGTTAHKVSEVPGGQGGSPRRAESGRKPNSYRESEMSAQEVSANPANPSEISMSETDYDSIEKKKAGGIKPVPERADNEAQF